MALSDVKVRSAQPEAKAYKPTDGEGMVCWFTLTARNTGVYAIASVVKKRCWHWGNILKCRWLMPEIVGMKPVSC